jgi:hypothetical protein
MALALPVAQPRLMANATAPMHPAMYAPSGNRQLQGTRSPCRQRTRLVHPLPHHQGASLHCILTVHCCLNGHQLLHLCMVCT